MNVIHGAWIPKNIQDFMQSGDFYLWVESDEVRNSSNTAHHPQHLSETAILIMTANRVKWQTDSP